MLANFFAIASVGLLLVIVYLSYRETKILKSLEKRVSILENKTKDLQED